MFWSLHKIRMKGCLSSGVSASRREDTALAPFLHQVAVAGKALKNWSIPEHCGAVIRYLEAARKEETFRKTMAGNTSIVAGYRRVMNCGAEITLHLSDFLE